jgi:hypothetical protein
MARSKPKSQPITPSSTSTQLTPATVDDLLQQEAPAAARSVVQSGPVAQSDLPTVQDMALVSRGKPGGKQPRAHSNNLIYAVGDKELSVLTSPEVAAYFGPRLKADTFPADVSSARQTAGARDRFANAMAVAAALYAAPGAAVFKRLALIMRDWDTFAADNPKAAAALAELRARWVASHPNKKSRKKSQRQPKKAAAANGTATPPAPTKPAS